MLFRTLPVDNVSVAKCKRIALPYPSSTPADRLIALGYAPKDARRLIGNVVAQEIFAVMQRGETYHEQQYILALRGLPESAV